jgi:mannose-6-phosphate isomerase-like protein (cupin superfamily)
MTAADNADGATARLAERLLGMRANREVIPPDPNHSVRWHQHSYPSPLARWNYHPEYEIHLIRKGTGKFIVGDHIGTFEAGHVALVGSGLPHDWVSDLKPGEVLESRDAVIQFDGKWIEQTAALVPEMTEVKPLLEQSQRGIEFLGASARQAATAIEAMGAPPGWRGSSTCSRCSGSWSKHRRTTAATWHRNGSGRSWTAKPLQSWTSSWSTFSTTTPEVSKCPRRPHWSECRKRPSRNTSNERRAKTSATWSANCALPTPGACWNVRTSPFQTSATKWVSPTCPTSIGISSTTPA